MKTNKAVENAEITPSKKKLTQARLPFKLISEDASTPVAPPTRKRKLSVDGTEPAPKGKICKENNEIDDLVVISDDECKDNQKLVKEAKVMNPFVKLVDTAWKKKLQKAKSPKKRKSRKSTSKRIESTENKSETEGDAEDVEMMDVETEEQTGNKQKSPKASPKSKKTEIEKENKAKDDQNDVVELEDSNDCSDVQKPNETEKESDTNTEADKVTAPVTPRTSRKSKSETDTEKSDELEPAPKTPTRKAKDSKDKANTSLPAKLNESVSSPTTPKRSSRSSSVTNSLNDSVSESASTPAANLTPKQMQKKLESAKKREEREKERQEREKKRQDEKEERARQRQEKEDAKKREREEKEEQKRKEKEEKEKQKELEKKLREEKEEQKKKEREEKDEQKRKEKVEKEEQKRKEKVEKEEQKRKEKVEKEEQKRKEKVEKEEQKRKEKEAREEEKRKKQEALELEKQEQELKKKKAAEAFVNFFVPKQKEGPKAVVSQNSILSSFTIKADMRLAPLIRVELSDMQKKDMDKLMGDQKSGEKDLYLKNLKKEGVKIGCSGKTWPLTDKDDDVMIVEDELPPIEGAEEVLACEEATREKLRPKLFSFHENKRPPYWGTWRKWSAFVTARRPFGQEKQLDYDVDSDEDWEEEQEGESLDGSVAGDDDEPDDDYEVDNEVFVPHGYLSDEEATMDEEEDKDNVLSLSPETQKARLKNLEDEFETEMKKPTEKLKPRLYGLIWETKDGGKPEKCIDALWNYFGKLSMIMDDAAIDSLLQPSESKDPEKKKVKKKKLAEKEQQSPKSDKKKKAKAENKESKKVKPEPKQETKKNQPGINSFLTKLKST
ncbi:chromatin assembly factor 1 subunit A-A-like [Cydia amplana]|uniref:chromatin assembly factor 1 subunit A-A-like n=1 Tax=Cydia amplana TaxID=1869771 RepID=UPI002FE5BF7F